MLGGTSIRPHDIFGTLGLRADATKGDRMFFIFIGLAVGTIAGLGVIPWLGSVTADVQASTLSMGVRVLGDLIGHISGVDPRLGQALGVVLGVALPGLICLFLIVLAKTGVRVRRVVGGGLLILGVLGFFFLPVGEALVGLVVSLIISVLFWLGSGLLIVAPLSALASALALSSARVLLRGSNPTILHGVRVLGSLSGFNAVEFWKAALLMVAWSGFVGALLYLFHHPGAAKA